MPPARAAARAPNPSSKPIPKPTPTPTPGKPACGTFTSDQIAWAAHELGVSQGTLKSAIKAHPATVCCLPHATKSCHPGKDDLAKLAKQVEALAHQHGAHDKDGHNKDSHESGRDKHHGDSHDNGHDNGPDNGQRKDHDSKSHDGGHDSAGHGKSGCGRAR
jgi:hypothetical protein